MTAVDERLARVVAVAIANHTAFAPWRRGEATGTLWIGFSGGMDSTVLAHALGHMAWAKAIHVDHGLHDQAADWREHCVATAAEFGLPIETRSVAVSPSGNVEAAARRARYACWRELLQEGDLLALAHHADDQAETRLWQLLTGRHPGGMPSERPLGRGRLVRPLLGVTRSHIAAYAARRELRWVEDPANADLRFDRNFIRHRVLPLVAERFPNAVARWRAPRRAAAWTPLPCAYVSPPGVQAWLLASGVPWAETAVAELVRQNAARPDRQPCVHIAPHVRAWRHGGAWHLVRELQSGSPPSATVGALLGWGAGELTWTPAAVGLPPGRRLAIRYRGGGECIRPAGRGVRKTVKALFREHRIAPWLRRTWPLLYEGESLVAVPGIAVAEQAAVRGGLFPAWTPEAEAFRPPAGETPALPDAQTP